MKSRFAFVGAIAGVTTCACVAAASAGPAQPATKLGASPSAALRQTFEPTATTKAAAPNSKLASKRGLTRKQLRKKLNAQMRRAGGASGAWVYDLENKKVLFSDHAGRRRSMASNSKIFTLAAALDALGPDRRFSTRLWIRSAGSKGKTTAVGGLALRGGGDPTLSSKSFAASNGLPLTSLTPLANAVKRAGIKKVTGNLVVDDHIFDSRRSIPTPGITGGPYLGTLSGLSYNSGYDGSSLASDPAIEAGQALERLLERRGVKVKGRVRKAKLPKRVSSRSPLAKVFSPTLADITTATAKPSNNFFAEMLAKRLGAEGPGQGTTRGGVKRIERFARKHGADPSMVNGSGLATTNVASPKGTGHLLMALSHPSPAHDAFRTALPIAGVDGTLANRMRGTAAQNVCQAKTGTLDGVSALSGYCETKRGPLTVFSILMNHVDITAAHNAQDAMASAIARYRP